MISYLQSIQFDIMLILSGISAATAFYLALSKSLDPERKMFLILTNVFTVLLLYFDRLTAVFEGEASMTAFWVVRISTLVDGDVARISRVVATPSFRGITRSTTYVTSTVTRPG